MAKIVRVLSPYTEDKGIAMLSVLGDDNKVYTWKHEVGSSKAEELKGAYDAYKAEHLDEIEALEEQSKVPMDTPAAFALKLKEELDKEVAAKRAAADLAAAKRAAANSKVDPEVEKLIDEDAERTKADIDKIVAKEPSLKQLGDETKADIDATAEKVKNGVEIVEEDKPKHNFIKGLALGVGAVVLTGALFATGFHFGKNQNDSEETQIEQENTIGKGLRENPNNDNAQATITLLNYDEAIDMMNDMVNSVNDQAAAIGKAPVDEKSTQALWMLTNNRNLAPEALGQLLANDPALTDPKYPVGTSFPAIDAISESTVKYGLGKADSFIDISEFFVDEEAKELAQNMIAMIEEARNMGQNNQETNENYLQDQANAKLFYDRLELFYMINDNDYTLDDGSLLSEYIGYHDDYEAEGNVYAIDQTYAQNLLNILSTKGYITQEQVNAITGKGKDPSTGEVIYNTRIFMVDGIMREWETSCIAAPAVEAEIAPATR